MGSGVCLFVLLCVCVFSVVSIVVVLFPFFGVVGVWWVCMGVLCVGVCLEIREGCLVGVTEMWACVLGGSRGVWFVLGCVFFFCWVLGGVVGGVCMRVC